MPVPARIEDQNLHAAFCACCKYICVAEKSGLTMEDVEAIEEQMKFLTNNFASAETLYCLENQIVNTLGFLEEHRPQGWEDDHYTLNDFLITVSEVVSCTS